MRTVCESDFVIFFSSSSQLSLSLSNSSSVQLHSLNALLLLMSNTKLSPPMKKAKSIDSKNDDAVLKSPAAASDDPNAPALVAANLSRKKATPPHPPKKLLIKFHKGTSLLINRLLFCFFNSCSLQMPDSIFEFIDLCLLLCQFNCKLHFSFFLCYLVLFSDVYTSTAAQRSSFVFSRISLWKVKFELQRARFHFLL